MTGFRKRPPSKPGVAYVCSAYAAGGSAACVRVEAPEEWAARQLIANLRDQLLLPERLEWLQGQLEERCRHQRTDGNLARLRKAVAAREAKLARDRSRMMECSRDLLPEAEAEVRATRAALEAARKELHEAETADPVRELKVTIDAAREALWRLESALEGDDRPLLVEALRCVLSRVIIAAEAYQTTTRKTRHRPKIGGIRLRPGSGLDILADLDGFRSESVQDRYITVAADLAG
jgi:hypothetical protein